MRIGLNLLYLIPGAVGGVETVGCELVRALIESPSKNEYIVFVSRSAAHLFESTRRCRVVVLPFDARIRVARYLWEQFVLPWKAWLLGVDLLHSLCYVGPVLCPAASVVTIHDANSRRADVSMNRLRRNILWSISRLSACAADAITTVSEFSKREIVDWYGLPDDVIRVIHSGPGRNTEIPGKPPLPLQNQHPFGGPYVAAIAGGYPHKNMSRLVDAYRIAASRIPHRLVLTGHLVDDIAARIDPDRVLCTGYLSTVDLRRIIAEADLFVMPSLYEGFGLPILEAQALGTPVACSNRASLPEIAGESAILFDPEDIHDIASAICTCVLDRNLNAELRERGSRNVLRFSWDQAASEYLSVYDSVLKSRVNPWRRVWITLRRLCNAIGKRGDRTYPPNEQHS